MISLFLAFFSILFLYISTLSNTIYGGDAGDLVSAILTKGFAHPPGYPLYTLIGRLFINIPVDFFTAAGKITLISSISTVFSLILVYLILDTLIGKKINKSIAIVTVLVLSVNYLIWLYAITPEVFPLNVLITLGILLSGLKFKNTGKLGLLSLSLFLTGLGVSHHHTFVLILPSLFILVFSQIKKMSFSFKKIFLLIFSLFAGLLPLVYLPVSSLGNPEIIWEKANSLSGFIALLTRQAYGSFVPGSFISNSPVHRFIQLINLNYFTFADFTLVGYLAIIIGLIILIRSGIIGKKEKLSIFLALVLFGPFFFFYANFPLRDKFELATVERFMIIFYFLLSIPLYFGLNWFFVKLVDLFRRILGKRYKLFIPIIIIVFLLFPIGSGIKNYYRLVNLKNNSVAEKLGKDILNNAENNSIILLAFDTQLFNTQYVYYSNKNDYPDKILIQTNKIPSEYYQKIMKYNHPKLIFVKKSNHNIADFIKNNIKNYNIYSPDKYPFPSSFPYRWVVQGLLFKIVPKDYYNTSEMRKTIETFWDTAENKDLANYYLKHSNYWFNYFSNDILRVYATGHQNTAYYYLNENKPDAAFLHIEQALILNPKDFDSLFLQSVYYLKINNCRESEKSIVKALNNGKDNLYIYQLSQITNCYKNGTDKERIKNLIKKYSSSSDKLLTE